MSRLPVSLSVGDTLEPRDVGPITQTDIVRFAGAGGDFNPLHHDPGYAQGAGLSGVIAMGQMQAGMLASWVSDRCHVEHLKSYSVRFSAPLFIGDTITFAGLVESVSDGIAELSLSATVRDRTVITGRARVRCAVG
ncbi:acyl dehydratase [Gordonia sp. TBRC 11910]|uniref:Acyl dehydratase n=1 Tax=Gordonia asplenii TaxID=2725283 RepID=A0A848L3N9_9ACTN|nr:MaoC/PaaZ C-terminal domain-containing protein [Gordonia asplenii]NMO02258.1 acyl dehydratase [Gordonia asplenii]